MHQNVFITEVIINYPISDIMILPSDQESAPTLDVLI